MKSFLLSGLALAFLLVGGPVMAADSYTGEWAYQALNAGDTSFKVEQQGESINFYRVLHPEFEGKPYQLEHMYKGSLKGKKIDGKMFVREEGMKDFEFLRPFAGEVKNQDKMVMDDMPLKRQVRTDQADTGTAVASADNPEATSDPKYTKVIVNKKPDTGPGKGVAGGVAQAPAKADTRSAPDKIPSLIPVGNQIQTEEGRKADKAMLEGDKEFSLKKYDKALEKYEEALKLNPGKVEALYKVGHCYGLLGDKMKRAGKIEGA